MTRPKEYKVELSDAERNHLKNLISTGTEKARKLTRARILLKANEEWTDAAISQALDVGTATVARIRRKYAEGGLENAIRRKVSSRRYDRKIDGNAEAHLIALICGAPPKGYARWSLRLLADRFVKLQQVEIESVSHETIRRILKKTN